MFACVYTTYTQQTLRHTTQQRNSTLQLITSLSYKFIQYIIIYYKLVSYAVDGNVRIPASTVSKAPRFALPTRKQRSHVMQISM